jgi:phage gp36-like protein
VTQYADIADLEGLGINPRALEQFSSAEKNRALTVMSSEADCYIPGRYRPLTTWPDALRVHIARGAAYMLLTSRGMNPTAGGNELIVKGYDDAIAYFKNIQRGIVTFPRDQASPDVGYSPAVIQGDPSRGLEYL